MLIRWLKLSTVSGRRSLTGTSMLSGRSVYHAIINTISGDEKVVQALLTFL
jgi:hypothetical protein